MIKFEKVFTALIISICFLIALFIVNAVVVPAAIPDQVFASNNSGDHPGKQQTNSPGEDWNSFRSEGYGFEIRFPDSIREATVYNRKGLSKGINAAADDPAIWEFQVKDPVFYQGTNLQEASLVVTVTTGEPAVRVCSGFKQRSLIKAQNPGKNAPPEVDINGVPFLEDRTSEGVMGGSYHTRSYRTLHADACYEITQLVKVSNSEGFASDPPAQYPVNKLNNLLDEVVATFQFLGAEPTFPAQEEPEAQPETLTKGVNLNDEYADGIDVSHWQGDINWTKVYNAGYSFAFAKATEGVGYADSYFLTNTVNGTNAGVLMGAYHFARPDLNNSGEEEAEWFLQVVGDYIEAGYLRPVLDLEVTGGMGPNALSAWVVEWMETVKTNTGVEPLIYTNYYFIDQRLNRTVADYDLWIAYWTCDPTPTDTVPLTGMFADWAFWQYQAPSGCGYFSIPGITGNVDLNIYNGVEEDLSLFESDAPLWVSLRGDAYRAPKPYFADLTVDVNGSETGPVDIHQWWNCNQLGTDPAAVETICGALPEPDSGSCLENENGARCLGIEDDNTLLEHTYQEIGINIPKVIVSRGSAPNAEDRFQIDVFNPIRNITLTPPTGSQLIIQRPLPFEMSVQTSTSLAGAVQLEFISVSSGDVVFEHCQLVQADNRELIVRDFTHSETEQGFENYSAVARYRVEGTCPVEDIQVDDVIESYSMEWIPPPQDMTGFYDPEFGYWYLKTTFNNGWDDFRFKFGKSGGERKPVTGDWDGDGVDTVGLYNPVESKWYLKPNNSKVWKPLIRFRFGPDQSTWIPLTGDWDGDGLDTVGLYDPSAGYFYLKPNLENTGWDDTRFQFGPRFSEWLPVTGDWDGDGDDTIGFYNPIKGEWYLNNENSGSWDAVFRIHFGKAGASRLPITGDWNGDGVDTVGLYNPDYSKWYLKNDHIDGVENLIRYKFGNTNPLWIPISGKW
jgi:GH25 family lysozyme M1 (1,4-beta-N-acetylmuramidase)/ribosomal protein S16